jgi:hypothetical protein
VKGPLDSTAKHARGTRIARQRLGLR